MKGKIVALIVGISIGAAGVAGASTSWVKRYNGTVCQTMQGGVACVRADGRGYGVGFHKKYVVVVKIGSGKTVYKIYQP